MEPSGVGGHPMNWEWPCRLFVGALWCFADTLTHTSCMFQARKLMRKKIRFVLLSSLFCATLGITTAGAQDRIYRCGNEYTNNANHARERGCKAVDGGNVTVLQSPPPSQRNNNSGSSGAKSSTSASATSPPNAPRVDNNEQRNRDSDARAILEAELRKAQTRLTDLQKEYNNGSPERSALELRNPQGYIERTAEVKANIGRIESDIAGIQREIGRLK